jgi:hypothetical protein
LTLPPVTSEKKFAESTHRCRDGVFTRNFLPASEFHDTEFKQERMMQSIVSKGLVAMAMSASLLAGGCATTEDVERAQATADSAKMTADQALAAAQSAGQRADAANSAAQQANSAAQQAQSAADRAQAAAQNASSAAEAARAESQRVRTTRLARGERG